MRLRANPNRMELLRLKKRLVLAERGHKLLKDKLDELMRLFHETTKQMISIKSEIETRWEKFLKISSLIRARHLPFELIEAVEVGRVSISFEEKRVLNLTVPVFKLEDFHPPAENLALIESEIEVARKACSELFPLLLEMAGLWRCSELLVDEIETTRRRVNALEYIMIPSLKETIRYIESRLEEIERSYKTQLMRIKDIIERQF